MEHPIIQIKNAITALLKGIDPDTDVFYEEIKGTEEKHGLDEPETYYFVDIIPNGNETVDRFFTDMGVLVDIAYHEKSEAMNITSRSITTWSMSSRWNMDTRQEVERAL